MTLAKAAHIDLEVEGGRRQEVGADARPARASCGSASACRAIRRKRSPRRSTSASRPSCASSRRPLRVLVFTSAATRDYQFLRSILVREMDKKRAEVSIYLQLPPGVTERHGGIVQDVPRRTAARPFPTRLEAGDKDDQTLRARSVRRHRRLRSRLDAVERQPVEDGADAGSRTAAD